MLEYNAKIQIAFPLYHFGGVSLSKILAQEHNSSGIPYYNTVNSVLLYNSLAIL